MSNRNVIFLFMLFYNMSITCANAVGVIVMKYGYGEIYWGKKASTADPIVYPLKESSAYADLIAEQPDTTISDLYPYYDVNEAENKQRQEIRAITVSLAVRQASSHVLATVTFHNKSNQNYFINRREMPSDSRDMGFGVMCSSSFLITTNNIKLDYLGHSCDFGEDIRNWWGVIKPGEYFSFIVPLNFAYEFIPGKHQYQIGSLEYAIATEQWFDEKIMFNTMFEVLDRRSECSIKTDLPLMFEQRLLCPQPSEDNLRSILEERTFDGDSGEYYFEIRTNQVSISIDADKNTSYHQFMLKRR